MPKVPPNFFRIVLAIMVASTLSVASAEDASKQRPQNAGERHTSDKGVLRLLPANSVTEHVIDTPRGKLAYTATAGTLAFFDQSGEQSASVFYTAYVVKNARKTVRLHSSSMEGPAPPQLFSISVLLGRAFSILDRTAGMQHERACATTPIPGLPSRISC